MEEPKVLVGCPTSNHKEYCLKEYVEGLKKLTYSNFDVLIVDNSETEEYFNKLKESGFSVKRIDYVAGAKERIVKARNVIVDKLLNGNYDYFLSLEQDVIPPVDVIQRFLKCKKEVVSGIYFKEFDCELIKGGLRKKIIMPMAFVDEDVKKSLIKQLTFADVKEDKLMDISSCGLGCILIHKDVFLKGVRFRYEKEKKPFDDVWFCKDVKDKGYDLYLDTSVKCKHLTKGMDWNKIKK